MNRERVTKGWYVEGILDGDPDDPKLKAPLPRQLSRVYTTFDAAAQFAAIAQKQATRYPTSVNVRTVTGYDDCKSLCG